MKKHFPLILLASAIGISVFSLPSLVTGTKAKSDELICTLGEFNTNRYYSQAGDGPAKIYQEANGNQYIKLDYESNGGYDYSSFYLINDSFFDQKGVYTLEFDLRYPTTLSTTNVFCSIFESQKSTRSESVTLAGSKVALDAASVEISGSTWKHAKFEIVLTKASSRDYDTLKIGFNTMKNANNYIDFDNIKLSKKDGDITYNETVNLAEEIGSGVKSLWDFEDVTNGFNSTTSTFEVLWDGKNNHYGKLSANSSTSSVDIYAKGYMTPNKRNFEFKVRKGPAFNGVLRLFATGESTNPTFDLSTTTADSWTTISGAYKVVNPTTDYITLVFETTDSNSDNYVLIDDICAEHSGTRNLINFCADFESSGLTSFSGSQWYYGERVMFDGPDSYIALDGNTKCLKLYKNSVSTNFTLKINPQIYQSGWYKLSLKIKGGRKFYCDNLGYRIYGSSSSFVNAALSGDTTILTDSDYYDYIDTWGEISSTFYLQAKETATYLGLNMWAFLHNDDKSYQSKDNYVLIDDIKIFRQNPSSSTTGENLISADISEIKNFRKDQGLQKMGFLSLDGYDYSKDIIKKNSLEQFAIGYNFGSCSKEQDYWGSISLDVPAKIVNEDGYHASLLTYDGLNITKNYSSMTRLFDIDELQTTKRYVFEFDYKLSIPGTNVAQVTFTGSANKNDFLIDLYKKTPGNYSTSGVDKYVYDYVISDNGNGWNHVSLKFQPDIAFKTRVNSIRFLLDAKFNKNNKFYIANVMIQERSNVPYNAIVPAIKVSDPINIWLIIGPVIGVVVLGGACLTTVLVLKKKKGNVKNEK